MVTRYYSTLGLIDHYQHCIEYLQKKVEKGELSEQQVFKVKFEVNVK